MKYSANTISIQHSLLIYVVLTCFCSTKNFGSGLHLTGSFKNSDFFKFLAKFGFQQADENNIPATKGYIFGNITSDVDLPIAYDMYLVVVDSEYLAQYYAKKDLIETSGKDGRCLQMFKEIDTIAWDRYCKQTGQEDFLRRIPCKKDEFCLEEYYGDPIAVYKGYQFTYHIVDLEQPRFWYVSMVACHRERNKNGHCHWSYNKSIDLNLSYDIWLVNGDPSSKHMNPFEHQFSFELHDVLEIYLTFFLLSTILLIAQLWFFRRQKHPLVWIISSILVFEVSGMFFNLTHISIFALDGIGLIALKHIGNFLDVVAQCITMLELLLIAKGWTITNRTLNRRILLTIIWTLYSIIYIILFVFTLLAVDPILDMDEWQTIPGYCILAFRVILMAYFVYELQDTFTHENRSDRRNFYIKFGAGFLVWFIYLPIIALISPKIAALWRFKTLLSIQSGADFCFILILVHLLWPSGDNSYFDIPRQNPSPDVHAANGQTVLLSDSDESSEDELLERQIRASSSYHQRYGIVNQISNGEMAETSM